MYRVDRFTSVQVTGRTVDPDLGPVPSGRFTRDAGFDLPAFWEERAEQFARSILRDEVVVRLSAEGARRLPYTVDPVSARDALSAGGDPDERGRVTVTLAVESAEVAHTQLAALGPEAEVLAPPELRARFARDAQRLGELYSTPPTT